MSGFHPKDLIKEVKCRPGLYDKDQLEQPKRQHKQNLWLEVGAKLTPLEDWDLYTDVEKDARVDEIQAKWKHLRDHFYREVKLVNSGEAHKKRKYVYYDEMEFMRPYVGFKLPQLNKSLKIKYSDSMDDSMDYMEENDTDEVMEELLKSAEAIDDERAESPEPRRNSPRRSVKPTPTPKAIPQKASSLTPHKNSKVHKDVIKNFDVLRKTSSVHPASSTTARSGPSFKIRDGDISFCLSLVPTFRKLSDSTKLRAKIEMLKILHKFVEHTEQQRTKQSQHMISQPVEANNTDEQHDMQEDHLLEDVDDTINVKHEENDDPLHASSGNTKAWWT